MNNTLDEYISSLKNYKGFAGDIVCHRTIQEQKGDVGDSSFKLSDNLSFLLKVSGIKELYSHQKKALEMIFNGSHTVIATPTSSGKSLIYNLPVVDTIIRFPQSSVLYLFPLKALARDQLETVQKLLSAAQIQNRSGDKFTAAVYDGDLTAHQKKKLRNNTPNILLSNPEMLHLSMLAHHHLWEVFFKNLKYVVIDEVHTYRGVMGSNMAWVFQRLKRICHFYGSHPQFVFCSATIANPESLARKLTDLDVKAVTESGSPAGKKEIILMRGLEGAAKTAITLIHAAVHRNLRSICYTQSRKITELIAIWASQKAGPFADRITAYRAGFLPEERRLIEKQLSIGELLSVVSTSALELGIDIGNLDLCILVGYPGTIMSTWQRAGRAGRGGNNSALILIAHEDALDQYFINHPDVFFSMPPEKAIINPDNPFILKKHLECAAAELRLVKTETVLKKKNIQKTLRKLEYSGRILKSFKGDIWYASRKAPHRDVNLRGTGKSIPILLEKTKQSLGEIDKHRSYFETHEGAVYLHRGKSYVITLFDPEKEIIHAKREDVHYFTRARSSKNTRIIKQLDSCTVNGTRVGFGLLKVTERITGYDKKLVSSQKSIGIIPLDLPEIEFETQGLWIEIADFIREKIEVEMMHFMGGIHALEHAAIGIMPLLVMTDRNDLGGVSIPFHPQTGKAAVFIYDGAPGGIGLTKQAFDNAQELIERTFDAVNSCHCETGCPACVHSPKCGSGNRPVDKASALKILDMILNRCGKYNFTETTADKNYKIIQDPAHNLLSEKISSYETDKPEEKNIRYAVLDIETRRSAKEVGGWNKAEKMGVSCVVVYDSESDEYREYLQSDIPELYRDLLTFDLIIGFNIIRFDYKVLSGLNSFDFYSLPTLDILIKIHERLGYRLSLDHLTTHTLGTGKSADGLTALKWWKEGKLDKIIKYCRQDVKVTRDLYRYGKKNGFLVFKNKAGNRVRVPVEW